MTRDYKGRYTSLKKVVHWFVIRFVLLFCFILSLLAIIGYSYVSYGVAYASENTKTVYIEKTVEGKRAMPPVLQRIAKCESGGKHVTEKGNLVINVNSDGSEDVGLFQINIKYWGLQAMKLGYNLTKEEDNIAFALWLYENKGTGVWVHSSNCWNK